MELRQLQSGVLVQRPVDLVVTDKDEEVAAADVLHPAGVLHEAEACGVDFCGVVVDVADGLVGQVALVVFDAVLGFHAELQDVELEDADHADDHALHTRAGLEEDLDGTLLGDLGHALGELLALHGVDLLDDREVLGSEGGDAGVLNLVSLPANGVHDGENAGVEHADDVAGVGLVDDGAFLSHHLLGLGQLQLPLALHVPVVLAPLEFTGADAHEGDAVPVGFVHVGLNLEDEGGEAVVLGIHRLTFRFPGQGRGGHTQKTFQERFDTEVVQGGAEEYGAQLAVAHRFQIEIHAGAVQQLHLLYQLLSGLRADQRIQLLCIGDGAVDGGEPLPSSVCIGVGDDLLLLPVIDSLEAQTASDGPVDGIGGNAELRLQLIQQIKGIPGFSVHLVDKGKNRNMPHGADLEELSGLGLNTLGGIDHHNCAVSRHKSTVCVLREILMSRSIKNIYTVSVIFELQNR